jgi:hypothetical protein
MSLRALAGVGSPFRELPSLEPDRGPSLEPERGPSLEPEYYGSLENVGNPFIGMTGTLSDFSFSLLTPGERAAATNVHAVAMRVIFGRSVPARVFVQPIAESSLHNSLGIK